jgi:ribose/xylose/arabinose/galactoside ABC-type transport system permease subunit
LGISDTAWIAFFFAVIIGGLLKWTVAGRYITAIGSNPEASRMAGVKVGLYRTIAFLILGVAVGIAGVLLMAQQSSFTPGIGTGFFLPPYVAAFFGMSVLGSHRFTVFGTVIGGLFIATFQQGLLIMAAPAFIAELIEGFLLLVILTIVIRTDRTSR